MKKIVRIYLLVLVEMLEKPVRSNNTMALPHCDKKGKYSVEFMISQYDFLVHMLIRENTRVF